MKAALENLTKIGGELYQAAAADAQGAGAGAPPPQGGDAGEPAAAPGEPKQADVVDADFEVVDDDKK